MARFAPDKISRGLLVAACVNGRPHDNAANIRPIDRRHRLREAMHVADETLLPQCRRDLCRNMASLTLGRRTEHGNVPHREHDDLPFERTHRVRSTDMQNSSQLALQLQLPLAARGSRLAARGSREVSHQRGKFRTAIARLP